ncbi:MAG: DUF4845 domain-containing protein [Telluria sp.]
MQRSSSLSRQSGISLIGLILVIAILGCVGLTAAKVLPTVSEYHEIKSAIAKAKAHGGSVQEMQVAFDRDAQVADITAIKGKDLIISRETGDTEISFDYEKRIPLFANASLLIEYSGTTAANGVVPDKPADK